MNVYLVCRSRYVAKRGPGRVAMSLDDMFVKFKFVSGLEPRAGGPPLALRMKVHADAIVGENNANSSMHAQYLVVLL